MNARHYCGVFGSMDVGKARRWRGVQTIYVCLMDVVVAKII